MPRIVAPNNPDCAIECPAGGYAFFIRPLGPCETGCSNRDFGLTLLYFPESQLESLEFSGEIRRLPAMLIGRFALRMLARDLEQGSAALRDLSEWADAPQSAQISARWDDSGFEGFLGTLLAAGGALLSGA